MLIRRMMFAIGLSTLVIVLRKQGLESELFGFVVGVSSYFIATGIVKE